MIFRGVIIPQSRRATRWTAFSLDSNTVLSGSDDMTVRCWDVATESEAAVLEGHTVRFLRGESPEKGERFLLGHDENTL